MKRDVSIFLEHILEMVVRIEENARSKEEFLDDINIQDATLRRLEVIGEAVKNIPHTFKEKYPKIPWTDIAGFRDKLIHQYFGVNLDLVWKVIEEKLPILKEKIEKIMEELK